MFHIAIFPRCVFRFVRSGVQRQEGGCVLWSQDVPVARSLSKLRNSQVHVYAHQDLHRGRPAGVGDAGSHPPGDHHQPEGKAGKRGGTRV